MTAHPSDSLLHDPDAPRPVAGARKADATPEKAFGNRQTRQKAKARRDGPDFERERQLIALGQRFVAGVDEVGRGPLAGPVTAAAVILDPDNIPDGLDDSKALSAARREALFIEILATSTVASACASSTEIDCVNIRGATLIAMRRAVAALGTLPDHVLVDGRDVPPGMNCQASAVIGGDAASLSIAAASIVAKVMRDRLMRRACQAFPGYGFSQHMGYGTATHLTAIEELGPSPLHRMTFSPLKRRLLLV